MTRTNSGLLCTLSSGPPLKVESLRGRRARRGRNVDWEAADRQILDARSD